MKDMQADRYVDSVVNSLQPLRQERTLSVAYKLDKVLKAFYEERLGSQHFSSITGSGHGDINRDVIDRIFARVLGAEQAAVRLQFVSGTHAIACGFFGILRPGDNLLSVTGTPYQTLEEVIGIRGSGQGSLIDFGVRYKQINLLEDGTIDFITLEEALSNPIRMIFIQRSCGYSWRRSFSINTIQEIISFVHKKQPECICFVDNCYGEFVENQEPTQVGADLIAGSLIKNLGGTIVPTGGYVAGRSDLVEQACCRLTSPGLGINAGTNFDLNRLILQGLFLAPQMVVESLIGADIVSSVFDGLGFEVKPRANEKRFDLIQAVCLRSPEALKVVCRAFQRCSPVGSYLKPEPFQMNGYSDEVIMAGGTFIDGSTSEFSADAPFREPYILYVQGGTHHAHIKLALVQALIDLENAQLLKLPSLDSYLKN